MVNDAHAHGRAGSPRRHPIAKLDQYLEDQLSAEQSQRIGEHLHVCQPCREEARRRSKVLRLVRQQQPASVLSTSDVRGVKGWKVVVGLLCLGAMGCVLLLTAWVLGGDNEHEPVAQTGANTPAAALLDDYRQQHVPAQNLGYEDILNVRNTGFACPLLTGLGYSYRDAQIIHDGDGEVTVELLLSRGGHDVRIRETRQLELVQEEQVQQATTLTAAGNKPGFPQSHMKVADQAVSKDSPKGSFKVMVSVKGANYLIEGRGTQQEKEQMVNYVALSEKARLMSLDSFPQDGVRDRFVRGFERLVGK